MPRTQAATPHRAVLSEIFLQTGLYTFFRGKRPFGRSWAFRVLQIGYILFTSFVIALYIANLTSLFTTRDISPDVASLEDITRQGVKFAVVQDSSIEAYFVQANVGPLLVINM